MKSEVCQLYDGGAAMADIGAKLGISRQRVHQILNQMRPKKKPGIRKHHKRIVEVPRA